MPDPTPPSPPPGPSDGWELACTGILRTQFGRRSSRALTKAMTQLAAEEAWTDARAEAAPGWRERLRTWLASLRPAQQWTLVSALVLVFAGAVWSWRSFTAGGFQTWRADSVCTVYDMLNVQLAAGARPLKVGDVLPAGPLRLESGVLELEFSREVKVAIEGPAELDLTTPFALSVQNGKLAAYVPRSGRGFTVATPNATVVDLGTQFGVDANDDSSAVAVFEGRVQFTAATSGLSRHLTPNQAVLVDAAGKISPATLTPDVFPQIGRAITINPVNCDFSTLAELRRGGPPAAVGFWSGPACSISGSFGDVHPLDGQGMLRFSADQPATGGPPAQSKVWQLMDLRPFKQLITTGGSGKLSAQFNRVRDAQAAATFGLSLAAFQGRSEDVVRLWSRRNEEALALAEAEIVTDADPVTWESLEIDAAFPPGTDFLMIELRASGPATGTGAASPFPGHFADRVIFKLRVPLRASSLAAGP